MKRIFLGTIPAGLLGLFVATAYGGPLKATAIEAGKREATPLVDLNQPDFASASRLAPRAMLPLADHHFEKANVHRVGAASCPQLWDQVAKQLKQRASAECKRQRQGVVKMFTFDRVKCRLRHRSGKRWGKAQGAAHWSCGR